LPAFVLVSIWADEGNLHPSWEAQRATDLEPVDGAAVDERRKHAKSVAERVSDGTHRQHNV